MVKGDKVRLNHELLIWVGFTRHGRIWTYPDGVDVDNSVPFFPEDIGACFKWLVPKLAPKTLMIETYEGGYDCCILSEKPSGGIWNGNSVTCALAICLAIQRLIRSK